MSGVVLRRWWPLGLVTVVVVVLALVDVIPRWSGLVGHVALPPLDLFSDLRLAAAEAPSPTIFVVTTIVAWVARVAVLTLVIGGSRRHLRFALAFYGIALPFGLLATTFDLASRAALYAPLFWAGLAITLVSFLLLGALPWIGRDRLRDAIGVAARRGPRLAVLLGYLVALGALAVVLRRPGDAIQVVIVPLGAALTAFAATRLGVRTTSTPRARVATAVALAATITLIAVTSLTLRDDHQTRGAGSRPGSLMLVPGVDTSSGSGALFRLPPRALGYSCAQTYYFSYAGAGDGVAAQKEAACPIRTGAPYRRPDTLRSLASLTSTFRRQIADLPRPITVVTHSQGAWIAWSGLAEAGAAGVENLVMLGAFPESLTEYPRNGESGSGAMAGFAVRAMTDVGRAIGFTTFDPDKPLARELQGTADAIEAVFASLPPRGLRVAAIASRFDLPLAGGGFPTRVTIACPGWSRHGGLPTSVDSLAAARRFVEGEGSAGCPRWARSVARAVEIFGAPTPRR